ncbi:P-loop containing nucleoside triphosphate hydrolase protein, partial [Mycena albidolilacea]
PASPKIFHGRETELEHLVDNLLSDPARVAILGPGGIGKTTLVVTALHSTRVVEKYPTRYFIPCDSVQTINSLVATIASHLSLEGSKSSMRHIIHHLTMQPLTLLILDNFETPWEPADGRVKIEEFLALLTDIRHVALLITMRGAERPSKVQWTHPFLHPLSPLSPDAAHQTFIEIADEIHDALEVGQLLEITDNIPLAVQLVANIAASEGCQATLERWKVETTALLSAGNDKQSNLEISIKLSLSSPRMASIPPAVDLLGLLSLLSDGISETDLLQSKPAIPEIAGCKTTLLCTSLAFIDHAGRLKVLAPIRDYVQTTIPPSPHLVRPLRKYFNDL